MTANANDAPETVDSCILQPLYLMLETDITTTNMYPTTLNFVSPYTIPLKSPLNL